MLSEKFCGRVPYINREMKTISEPKLKRQKMGERESERERARKENKHSTHTNEKENKNFT